MTADDVPTFDGTAEPVARVVDALVADTPGVHRPAPVPIAPGYTVTLVRSWHVSCDGCGASTMVTGRFAAVDATAFYASHPESCGR